MPGQTSDYPGSDPVMADNLPEPGALPAAMLPAWAGPTVAQRCRRRAGTPSEPVRP